MRARSTWALLVLLAFCGDAAWAMKPLPKLMRPSQAGDVAAVAASSADRVSSTGAAPGSGSSPISVDGVAGAGSDACQTPEAISGTGAFGFDSTSATLDGPAHAACNVFNENQIDHDVWFCWTAPAQACSGAYSISTCGRTTVDTRIAVYNGCACPTNDTNLLNCRDDECGTQTRLFFDAVPGQQYLIRMGTFPGEAGGTGTFLINCELEAPCQETISHCQPQDQSDALNSSRTGQPAFLAADGFTPTQSGNVNSVCWWGAYLNRNNQDCEAVTTDSFRIRYFTSVNGLPGTLIATFSQAGGTLTVDPAYSTGLLVNNVAPEYEFHATHANVPVVAGTCYWIEISNDLTGCTWFWELGLSGDGRAVQDGSDGNGLNGYSLADVLVGDLAFCTNLTIAQEGISCLPPPPSNDNCVNARVISGQGTFIVDTASATTDGPAHSACLSSGQSQIGRDAWFKWTSSCSGDVVVRTCDSTTVDSKVAVYNGTTCPTAVTAPAACNDDLCGQAGLQSMVVFPASLNQQFLIRAGSFPESPGGVIGVAISCGAPNNAACGSGSTNANCCSGSLTDTPGCGDEACCELVCACDPFCCETEWDTDCAGHGLGGSGCGAADLCTCEPVCGSPDSGDCCTAHSPGQFGCNNQACCEAVCACDPYCCDTEWDENCAGAGFLKVCQGTTQTCTTNTDCAAGVPCVGCGAGALCSGLCSSAASCPSGTITFVNPPGGAVDARRPYPPGNPSQREGFKVFTVNGPSGAQSSCWSVQETAAFGSPNTISSVVENPSGTYTITLSRVITSGAGTSLTYTPTTGTASRGCFKSHSANVNSDTAAAPVDILHLIDNLNGIRVPPLAIWQCDIDRSGICLPADIITEIDLLNGTNGFIVWNGTSRPTGPGTCP